MAAPTTQDVDTLFGAATPHFAYQIRQRVERLVADLPAESEVRAYAAARLEALDRLGRTNSKAVFGDPSRPHDV